MAKRLGFDHYWNSELTEYYSTRRSFLKSAIRYAPENSALFIGDSRTEGLSTSAIAAQSVNLGIGGDTTIGVLERIGDYEPFQKWEYVELAIGYNDLKYRGDEEIVDNIRKIVNRLGRDVPIFVMAILVTDETVKQTTPNTRIRRINSMLVDHFVEIANVEVLDPNPYLVDEQGALPVRYHVGDGVHLNDAGQAILIDYLRSSLPIPGVEQ